VVKPEQFAFNTWTYL